MKPMLLSDWDESKVRFPVIAQPKVDGVRGMNMTGTFTGRSLKTFGNRYLTTLLSHSALVGLDGEVAAQSETHPDLCRLTTSALSTQDGEPFVLWWLFDLVTEQTSGMGYADRLACLRERYHQIIREHPSVGMHLRLMPSVVCNNMDELIGWDTMWLAAGYEGSVICDPLGKHKQGRSTVREGGKLRIKRFVDAEAVVIGVTEGETNLNEATINELGLTERSTHQANMVPNGMVGTLQCRSVSELTVGNQLLLGAGDLVTVSAGRLTGEERKRYLANPAEIVGRTIKFQFFPKGIKDKPRFPTFQSFRDSADMGDGE